jgi:hypothetical protein
VRIGPFPGNQLPMPAQQGVGRDDPRNVTQPATAKPVRPHGEPPPIVVRELDAPPTQLPSKDAILFKKIAEYFSLSAVQPTREDGEHQLKGRGGDHGRSLYQQP